eukprot:2341153-Amphidinium_carterae.1
MPVEAVHRSQSEERSIWMRCRWIPSHRELRQLLSGLKFLVSTEARNSDTMGSCEGMGGLKRTQDKLSEV